MWSSGQIVENLTWAYKGATNTGGSSWDLVKGQKDRVTAVSGNGGWVRLACGGWVESKNILTAMETVLIPNALSAGRYTQGVNEDIISWQSQHFTATTADLNGNELIVRFGMQKTAPAHSINPVYSVFESVRAGTDNGAPCYIFTLKPDVKIEGFYTDYVNGELRFHLKKRKTLVAGSQPLLGFNIMLDAGHGATDSGAIGPMGTDMAEKDLNLANVKKTAARLRQMGANVTFVRETDVYYELHERAEMNKSINPDLYISIHGNAMDVSTDSTNISGLTVWHRNAASKPLADSFIQTLHSINPNTNRRVESSQSTFYVCRPAWAPSIIIETSFMCNIQDFSWMVSPTRQDEFAWAVVNAVLAYYR